MTMKRIILNANDLKDSREIYESKPKPIGIIFIYLLLAILISVLIFSFFGKKDIILNTSADIQYSKASSTITNAVEGKVNTISFKETEKVKKGDTLLKLNDDEIIKKKESIESDLEKLKKQKELNNTLKESIENNKDLFSKEDEWGYKRQFESYSKEIILIEKSRKKIKLKQKRLKKKKNKLKANLNQSIEDIKSKLNRISKLKNSIENDKKFSKKKDKYDSYYDFYQSNKKNLDQQIKDLDKINKEDNQDELSKEKENIKTQIENLKQENLIKLNEEEEELKQSINNIENSKENNDLSNLNSDEELNNYSLSIEQIKKDIQNQIAQKNNELKNLIKSKKDELDFTKLEMTKYTIKAPNEGYVNIIHNLSEGDNLQTGTQILKIVPENEELIAKIYIPSNYIANVGIGDKVRFSFDNIKKSNKQTIEGNIVNISPDSSVNQSGDKFYIAESTIKAKDLHKYNGDKQYLKNGMTANVSIIVDSKRYIDYIFDELNFQ